MDATFYLRLWTYWLPGLLGALARVLLLDGKLIMPSWDAQARAIRLGFLGSLVLGVLTAAWADSSEVTAFTAAIAGPVLLEGLIEKGGRVVTALSGANRG